MPPKTMHEYRVELARAWKAADEAEAVALAKEQIVIEIEKRITRDYGAKFLEDLIKERE